MSAKNIQGTLVPEEEVAKHLGFTDVFELRRWQTELGHKFIELEYKLYQSKNNAENFKWYGLRQEKILDKIYDFLNKLEPTVEIEKLKLAILVVCGKGVDWDNILKDWL